MPFFEIKYNVTMVSDCDGIVTEKVCEGWHDTCIVEADTKELAKKYKNRVARTKVIEVVKCNGEAHRNPHIDNCMMCMPRWGWREVKEKKNND